MIEAFLLLVGKGIIASFFLLIALYFLLWLFVSIAEKVQHYGWRRSLDKVVRWFIGLAIFVAVILAIVLCLAAIGWVAEQINFLDLNSIPTS